MVYATKGYMFAFKSSSMSDSRSLLSQMTVENRLLRLEGLDFDKTKQIQQLQVELKELKERKQSSVQAPSIVIRSAVWDEFTSQFWSRALVKVNDEGNISENVDWKMPADVASILEGMGATRRMFPVVDHDANGDERTTKYYCLSFLRGKNGSIPTEWAAYSSWKFALKVKYFLNLTIDDRLKAISTSPAYAMFKDSESLLYGRLKMLSAHLYEIHKLTWTRMRANKDAQGAKVGPTTMSVDDMIAIQTPFMQQFLQDLASRVHLKNRQLYSEHMAGSALASLLRNFKDTDRYVERETHGVGLSTFGSGKKKVKITAPVPLPFEKSSEQAQATSPDQMKATKRKASVVKESAIGKKGQQSQEKAKKRQEKHRRSLKLLSTSQLPKLKLKLSPLEQTSGKKKSKKAGGVPKEKRHKGEQKTEEREKNEERNKEEVMKKKEGKMEKEGNKTEQQNTTPTEEKKEQSQPNLQKNATTTMAGHGGPASHSGVAISTTGKGGEEPMKVADKKADRKSDSDLSDSSSNSDSISLEDEGDGGSESGGGRSPSPSCFL